MAFSTPWSDCRNREPTNREPTNTEPRMSTLQTPVTPHYHIRGPASAPVTLVEYGDYECPHCGAAHPIVNLVQKHFGPRLRLVFRHFPLSQVHPHDAGACRT